MTPRHIDTHDSPTCIRHSSWRHCRMRIRLPHRECILCWKPTSRSSMRRADNECCPDSRGSKSHIERQVLRVCQPHKMCSHRCRRRCIRCNRRDNPRRCRHWCKADCSNLRCRSGCLACTRSSSRRPSTRCIHFAQMDKMCKRRCWCRRMCCKSNHNSRRCRHWRKADCSTLRCRSGCLACTRSSSRPNTRRNNVAQTDMMCSHRCRCRRMSCNSNDNSRRCSHLIPKADCSTLRCRSGCLACTRSSSRHTRRKNVGGMTQTNKMCSNRCRRRGMSCKSNDSSYNSRSMTYTNCTNRHRIARFRRPIAA
jgi:hypothetical protein